MQLTVKMYNAGYRISEPIPFSLAEGHDPHCLGKWYLDAPEKSFFKVPIVLELSNGSDLSVRFPQDIIRKFGKRGVIWVNPEYAGEIGASVPIAKTEEEAKEKGDRIWGEYLDDICRKWIEQCHQIAAGGGKPGEAQGFTKRALKERGIADPGQIIPDRKPTSESGAGTDPAVLEMLTALQREVADLRKEKLKAEADKKADEQQDLDAAIDAVVAGGDSAPKKKK
jgi:hypothetical protein